MLVVATSGADYVLGSGSTVDLAGLCYTCVGTMMVAAFASTLNQAGICEVKNDAMMSRTRRRPLPSGRISIPHAVTWASSVGLAGTALLASKACYNWAIAIADRAKLHGRTKEAEALWKQVIVTQLNRIFLVYSERGGYSLAPVIETAGYLFGESDGDRLNYALHAASFDLYDSDMADRKRRATDGDQDDVKRMKTNDNNNLCELCDEEKIVVFFNKLLAE